MLTDLLQKNRSYRSFDETRSISKEELLALVETTRLAPSSVNLQPLKYRPVYEKTEVAKVQKLTKWAGLIKDTVLPPEGHMPAAFLVICHDLAVSRNPETFLKDVGICAQTVLLAATELGLGGCMIGSFEKEALCGLLKLDKRLLPQLLLALGKPDETVVLEDARDGNVAYYRKDGVHHVPKRPLADILIP